MTEDTDTTPTASTPTTSDPACTLDEDQRDARSERFRTELLPALDEIEEGPDGFTLRFERSAETYDTLAEIAWLEADCCAFATHVLEVPADGGPVAWHWRTDAAGKDVLRDAAERFEGVTLPT